MSLSPKICYHKAYRKETIECLIKVSIVIEKGEHGYYAYCPELEGCKSQGDSFEEVITNIREAIELYLETLSEEEIKESLSKEILTTTLKVQVA